MELDQYLTDTRTPILQVVSFRYSIIVIVCSLICFKTRFPDRSNCIRCVSSNT